MCVLIAAAVISVAGGCGTGAVERLLPAAGRTAPDEGLQAGADEKLDRVFVPPASQGIPTEIDASPRPVRVYLVGPSSYLATNQPNPPSRLLAERKVKEVEKPTERRTSREVPESREASPQTD